MNWYEVNNIAHIESPSLLIYKDRVEYNIEKAIQLVGNHTDRLRPHIKTHKSPYITQLLLNAGISKFKCATIAEAEMLAQSKAKDILIAYQLTGPNLNRYVQLIKTYPDSTFSSLIDNDKSLSELTNLLKQENLQVNVFIDLDIGMHRTGIAPNEKATNLVKNILTHNQITLSGFQLYDGHLRDADLTTRTNKSDECFVIATNWINSLELNFPIELICGGSPTFIIHAKRENVVCSPGTFVYWDHGYNSIPDTGNFLPAALLVSRVISKPDSNICVDLGHKAVAAENSIDKRVYFLNADDLIPIGQSEEHLVLKLNDPTKYEIGDVLYALPYHVCPTVALHDTIKLIENNSFTQEYPNISRSRKLTL